MYNFAQINHDKKNIEFQGLRLELFVIICICWVRAPTAPRNVKGWLCTEPSIFENRATQLLS